MNWEEPIGTLRRGAIFSRPSISAVCLLFFAASGFGTTITLTRADVSAMAGYWIVDSTAISSLANEQYTAFTGQTWNYSFPHSSVSSDGDVHIDAATNSSGSGQSATCCDSGDSPITVELTNASSADRSHIASFQSTKTRWDGVFRFRTEHSCASGCEQGERKFEIHPLTKFYTWNGSAYTLDTDYTDHVADVANGRTHAASTLAAVFTDTYTALVVGTSATLQFTFPDPQTNYTEYVGTVTQGTATDAVSSYFLFHPTQGVTSTGPSSITVAGSVKVRLVPGSGAATAGANLHTGNTCTVNALTRVDFQQINSDIAALSSGSITKTMPIELIALGITSVTPVNFSEFLAD